MYQSFISLEEAKRNPLRIHDPWSYQIAYQEPFVPLTIAEAFLLASHFPIVWKRDETGKLYLVAVRGFAASGKPLPGIGPHVADALPLLLQAYPLRFRNERAGDVEVGVDRVAPSKTRDIGAALFARGEDFTAGAELKRLALSQFEKDATATHELTALLSEMGVLELIALPKSIVERYSVPELFHMGSLADDRNLLNSLLQQFGNMVLTFIVGHRLSLFRMGPLIALANTDQVNDKRE